ncbi:MAG TPA: adenylyl-sulfate kinase [Nitrospirota bacterium]
MRSGHAFWLTGLPGSGKTVLSLAAKREFPELVLLHMDEMRKIVTPLPTYSEEERDHLYLSLVYTAMVLTREGRDIVIDATANRRAWRDSARRHIRNFHEIYIKCPIELCREREAKRVDAFAPADIYKKGKEGAPVPGVNVAFEEPVNPELVVDCTQTLERAEGELISYLKAKLK